MKVSGNSESLRSSGGIRWVTVLVLAMAVLASYWPVLDAGFMYDDRFFVTENPAIRDPANIPALFTSPRTTTASIPWDGIWRPLRGVSYAVDYAVWGLRPFGFHLTNLLLHFANGFLVTLIAGLLLGSGSIGLVAGLLFLIHPAQTEAVAWISSRGDLLLAFFLLGAWLSRIRYQRNLSRRWLSLALILYAQALLSKETAVMLPVAFIIADIMTPAPDDVRTWRQRLPEYSAWWGVTLVYFAMRSAALGGLAQRPYWGGSLWSTILVMLWAGAEYLRLLVLPLWLHVDYVISPVKTLSDWRWVAGVGLGLVITTLVVARYRRQRWPAFAWAWFLVFLLPVSNLVPITAIMAERFLYLPIIGACLLAAQGLSSLPQRTRVATLLMIAIPCVALSARRTFEWREPVRFWTVEVARSPLSVIAWNNLGQQYYRNGNLLTAENSYRRAIAIDPYFPGVRASLGDVYYKSGRYQEALGEYRAYLELNPDAHNRVQAEQRMQRIRDLLSRQPEAR